jgi:hypothetical protein
MTRIDDIRSSLLELAGQMGCIPSDIPLDDFIRMAPVLQPPFRFGWLPPIWLDRAKREVVIAFCPEQIERTTAESDDDEFQIYLDCCLQLVAGCVALLDTEDDAMVRYRLAEDKLIEAVPIAFQVLSDVQFAAVDRGVAA